MTSQVKYIVEASVAIMLALVTIKGIQFFSSSVLYDEPRAINTDVNSQTNLLASKMPGRTLFLNYCASCHAVTKDLTGPALAGMSARVPDRKLLIAWIRNNREVLRSGNPYFTDLFEKYEKISMPLFPNLGDPEIESIIDYIEN